MPDHPAHGAHVNRPTLYLDLPCGTAFGWGVCGKQVTLELAERANVRYVNPHFNADATENALEFQLIDHCRITPEEHARLIQSSTREYPVLQAIGDQMLRPVNSPLRAGATLGYTFFEAAISREAAAQAAAYFDILATGSEWCSTILREQGCPRVATVIQGVDPLVFHAGFAEKQFFRDAFVVFSGGKFEFRKGQDIVIRAYKVFQDRHRDVMLINSWYNAWDQSARTMEMSPLIQFRLLPEEQTTRMNRVLAENGIDLSRVISLPPYPNPYMPRIYQNTDVGLFPNRCEGGTNLVLMEYMACGKPAIVSDSSGHRDLNTDSNARMIRDLGKVCVMDNGVRFADWDEPSLDETIEHLEWAYEHRTEAREMGSRAAAQLSQFTWRRTADHFYQLLTTGL